MKTIHNAENSTAVKSESKPVVEETNDKTVKASPKLDKVKDSSIPHTDSKIKKKDTKESRTTSTSVNKINEVKTIEEKIIDKGLQVKKEVTRSRSDLSNLKSEIKEVIQDKHSQSHRTKLKSESKPVVKRINDKH